MATPSIPRVVAFFDAQNLYYSAKREFRYTFPNYDPIALAEAVAARQGWQLIQTRVYTGMPDAKKSAEWQGFWTAKLADLQSRGAYTFSRQLDYWKGIAREKGIDVRISIDIIRMAMKREYDVALLFSQDQDLSEVAKEIREVAQEQQRWIKIASAFPLAEGSAHRKGVNFTDWLPIDKALYDACIDPRDYRPKSQQEDQS